MRKLQGIYYQSQRTQPTAFDDSLSLYELLNKVVYTLNNSIDDHNDMVDSFNNLLANNTEFKTDVTNLKKIASVQGVDIATLKADSVKVQGQYKTIQSQLNKIVIEGDSSVESAQARIATDINGQSQSFETLKERLDTQYNQLINVSMLMNDFPRLEGELNDDGRFTRAFHALSLSGGRLLLTDHYVVTELPKIENNEIDVVIEGVKGSSITLSTLTDGLVFKQLRNVTIKGVTLISTASPAWNTNNRQHGLRIENCLNVSIEKCKIQGFYGMGIFLLYNDDVSVLCNEILNCRGYNYTVDNYGDGVYLSQGTKSGVIFANKIINEVDGSHQVGRIGITLEFDVENIQVKGNVIEGYNRGIHSELTGGGHLIEGNTISKCFVGFVSLTEKGDKLTIVRNNHFTNDGFINDGSPLRFYQSFIQIGQRSGVDEPHLQFVNNQISIVANNGLTNTLGLVDSVSINRMNVTFNDNVVNCFDHKNFFSGSLGFITIDNNILTNVGNIRLWYTRYLNFTNNTCVLTSMDLDGATNINVSGNSFKAKSGTLGSLLKNRPSGKFNDNTITDYGAETIDNKSYGVNNIEMELSGNLFVRALTSAPLLPLTVTTGNIEACDVFYSSRPNRINDTIDSANNRDLVFYYSAQYLKGRKFIISNSAPTNRTWSKGDICINNDPDTLESFGWVCTVSGTPGTWEPIGVVGMKKIPNKSDSVATTIESLKIDFNDLLARLRANGFMG